MRKPSFKISKFEVKKGVWKYKTDILTNIEMKKGDISFKTDKIELYEDKESLKIGTGIYEIEKIEENEVFLVEPIIEDFKGYIIYEWSLPIVIRNGMEHTKLTLASEVDMPRKNRKVVPLARMDKKSKVMWMEILKEENPDVEPATISITVVDELEEQAKKTEFALLKMLVELVLYIDMDEKGNDGKDIWTAMNVKKGNFVDVATILSSQEVGILGDEDQISKLKFTIEAIKNGEENVDAYVEKKITEADIFKKLLEIRKSFDSEEAYQKFVNMTINNLKEAENV